MTKHVAGLAVAGLLMSTGCAAGVWYGNLAHPKSAMLRVGLSQQDARALFGPPQHVGTQQVDRLLIETWTYLDRTLVFHNGALTSWDKN